MSDKKLKKYQKLRKDNLTVFGGSVHLDWFIMNLIVFIFIIFVFVFLYLDIKDVITYEPVEDINKFNTLNDTKILSDLDNLINDLEKNETKVETQTDLNE